MIWTGRQVCGGGGRRVVDCVECSALVQTISFRLKFMTQTKPNNISVYLLSTKKEYKQVQVKLGLFGVNIEPLGQPYQIKLDNLI